jgi:hypothetical protein
MILKTLPKIDQIVNLDFEASIKFKNCSLNFLAKKRPELKNVLQGLIQMLPKRKHITINLHEQVLQKNSLTCSNVGWHLDGTEEDYLLVCFGQYRTEFLNNDGSYFEIEEGIPILYDSQTVHRGRIAESKSKRILIRICSSDRIVPINHIIKDTSC